MKLVLDTNVWVISLTSRSAYHYIYQALIAQEFELIVTHEMLLEYEEIIHQRYGNKTADHFMDLLHLLPNVHFLQTYFQWNLIENDKEDNKFVDVAIAGGADYLVTEDSDFNILKNIPFPQVTIIRIDDLLKLLRQNA
ncbi:MAG: putative toxin-antitoxin system toxin component, PIN family [Saprospiraceae bacterium]|nr:putative toxin-antitoxin system toxin component, PIN family [Saprospiraceae bacterium]